MCVCVCVWFLSAQYFSVSFSASKSLTIVKLCRERNIAPSVQSMLETVLHKLPIVRGETNVKAFVWN